MGNKVSRYHQVIEEAEEDGFSLLVDYGGGGDRELWTCSEPGLARVDQLRTGPRGGPPPPGVVSFHHRRAVGVTIPSDLDVGSSWKQVVTSFARFTVEGVTYTEKQVATTSYDVVGRESVTTLAGTFEALVVRTVAASHKTAPEFGNGIDTRVVSRYTQWWAPGVGMVRLASSEGPGATIDLVTFRFPDPS